jgi:hypothetical protein
MRILREHHPRDLEMKTINQESNMDRRDFLKKALLLVAGWTIFKWFRSFGDTAQGLKEARFYRRADHLAG